MNAYVVSARPLGWGSLAVPSDSVLVIASDGQAAREQAITVWAATGRFDGWNFAAAGTEDDYRSGRGPDTPAAMWLAVYEVDWDRRHIQAASLRTLARAAVLTGAIA